MTSSWLWFCTLKRLEPWRLGWPFQPGGRGPSADRGTIAEGGGGPLASDDSGFSGRVWKEVSCYFHQRHYDVKLWCLKLFIKINGSDPCDKLRDAEVLLQM